MDMTMESCRKFVEVLASDAPAPGGGGAAALVGAIGTALGNMVEVVYSRDGVYPDLIAGESTVCMNANKAFLFCHWKRLPS